MIPLVWLVIFFFQKCLKKFRYQRFISSLGSLYAVKVSRHLTFKFSQNKQHDEESVIEYITELQKLSVSCAFGDILDDMLRDKHIYGLSRPKMQKFLLGYKKLAFVQAHDISVSMEIAEENAKLINDSPGKSNMLKLKDTYLLVSCYRCRGKTYCITMTTFKHNLL